MELLWALESFDLRSVIDILIVAFLFFGASMLFRGTQAVALLRGTLLLIVVLVALSALFQLQALGWVISNLLTVVAVAIPVIFQPGCGARLSRSGAGQSSTPRGSAPKTCTPRSSRKSVRRSTSCRSAATAR